MNLSVVRLAGEIGYQGGKDQQLSTDFEDFDTTKESSSPAWACEWASRGR